MKASEILIKGRDFLATHKWGRGMSYNSDTDAYCALGGLYASLFGEEYLTNSNEVSDEFYQAISKDLRLSEKYLNVSTPSGYTIVAYNDTVAKRKRDVISAFNRAIKLAQQEGN